ncbi:baseplate hub distal subunit protein [Acinetobacter phage vB_AbaM_DLP2]|nr:baseplate hub distal subunit protein [Acinetobacter phage vB_AbaM_DLP2]
MGNVKLELEPKSKVIEVNGKTIKVPKLGLKHRLLMKEGISHEDAMKVLLNYIQPNLSLAERDLLTLHLLEYNGRIRSQVKVGEFLYDINNAYICQQLKFNYEDYEFKFRSPTMELMKGPLDILLKECCVSVKKSGEKIPVPDFMDMPAFVYRWADMITNTVAIDGPFGQIRGLYKVVELFSE